MKKCKVFPSTDKIFILDSLPCEPSLLPLDKVLFIPPNKVKLIKATKIDSIELCFNVLLPSRLKTKYQTRSPLENSDNPIPKKIILNDTQTKSKNTESQLFTNGSVSRGISSGNNQGFLINSDLNLQMQGDLGKGVRLTAAVSDNNSPLQPDGTTLKVQDFDRVFIKVDKDSWFAIAGDYFMQNSKANHFMAFNKKSRGLQFDGVYNLNEETKLRLGTNAAVSRGRFSRNEIQGQEGLQGPYRLSGSQNEAFIIVIAATEVVFVDGKQLKRGQQNDYVINYNTAEIIFNPNILIIQYSRIVIEFQYADQNYSRVLFNQFAGVEKEKLKFRFNYFIEQDNKNQPFQAEDELSLFDSVNSIGAKQVLSAAGDNESAAVMSTIRLEESFDPNKILYKKIDTLGFFDVLRYTPIAEGGPYFSAIFSNVGQGKGNYIQTNTAANGRVYSWVEPENGVPQGSFEPVIQLVAPNRQQMATVAIDYKLSSKTNINAELAYSQFDANTFSVLDKNNDDAFGSFINLLDKRKLGNKDWSNSINW